ncbi:MAG: hypothetical protein GXP53_13970 [Deltaproteobacteria bacterium]|nr:hypothetical protein [Deltaproteobacteria bacterium]
MDKANTLFEKPGKSNTVQTLKLARARAEELGINEVAMASTTGETAYQALEILAGFKLVAVTYHCGFREPFQGVMEDNMRKNLEEKGVRIIEATHALSGVERSIAKKYTGSYPVLLVADTLRLFGQGTKVAVEITVMAADGGALTGKDIIAIGGSGRGADTACVIKPAHQSNFFDLRVREIICKPRTF